MRRPACACAKSRSGGDFSSVAPGVSVCGACGGSLSGSGESGGNNDGSSPLPPAYYSEPDFYVGAPLRLHGRGFMLLSAEEPALRRMEASSHPLARREAAAAAARAALESAAEEASAGSAVAFGGSELLREALAAVVLQKREREEKEKEKEKEKGVGEDSRRRGAAKETLSSPSSPLFLLTPEELGEAFAAAGAPLGGPPQVKVTLARALGGSERPGNRVDAAEVVERLFG